MYPILFMFLMYGFLGWCWETPYVSLHEKKFINRGFLTGPIIPIYAFGSFLMITLIKVIEPIIYGTEIGHAVLYYFVCVIVCSMLEYVISFALEVVFHARWWDYSYKKWHIHGRVCLTYSLGWGFGGLLLWYVISPLVNQLYDSIPKLIGEKVVFFLAILLAVDGLNTLKSLINFRTVLSEMQQLTVVLSVQVSKIKIRQEEFEQFLLDTSSLFKKLTTYKDKVQLAMTGLKNTRMSYNIQSLVAQGGNTVIARAVRLQEALAKSHRKFFIAYPNLKTSVMNEWIQEMKEHLNKH